MLWLCRDTYNWDYQQQQLKSVLGAFAKLLKATISFMSVRPQGTTRLPQDGFSLNLIFEDFSKIFRENSSFIKIGQE
jgi:hypothetical protein